MVTGCRIPRCRLSPTWRLAQDMMFKTPSYVPPVIAQTPTQKANGLLKCWPSLLRVLWNGIYRALPGAGVFSTRSYNFPSVSSISPKSR